jgi:Lon protease-like protein
MQTRTLPLFPLPLVLFPGVSQALHIFEPRYRQLLADCQDDAGEFGITPVTETTGATPAIGTIGCTAVIRSVTRLPDGRSNILVTGGARYAVVDYVESDRLYLVADVTPIDDEPEWNDEPVLALAGEVRRQFDRYRRVVRQLPDQPDLREPPAEPGSLSFAVAGALPLDLQTKVRLLELRSVLERLSILRDAFTAVTEQAETQARVQRRAKRNGRRPLAPGGLT